MSEMETKNYILKEIESADIKDIYEGLSDPAVTKYYDVHYSTLEDTKKQMKWFAHLKKSKTGIWWGIYDKSTNQFYGAGGFNHMEKENEKAEIGLWLLKRFWGKGIMKEVMPKLFELGFTMLKLNRIEGYVVSDNVKCKRAIEKINFKHEGTMREYEIGKLGEKLDYDIYAILKKEWEHSKSV